MDRPNSRNDASALPRAPAEPALAEAPDADGSRNFKAEYAKEKVGTDWTDALTRLAGFAFKVAPKDEQLRGYDRTLCVPVSETSTIRRPVNDTKVDFWLTGRCALEMWVVYALRQLCTVGCVYKEASVFQYVLAATGELLVFDMEKVRPWLDALLASVGPYKTPTRHRDHYWPAGTPNRERLDGKIIDEYTAYTLIFDIRHLLTYCPGVYYMDLKLGLNPTDVEAFLAAGRPHLKPLVPGSHRISNRVSDVPQNRRLSLRGYQKLMQQVPERMPYRTIEPAHQERSVRWFEDRAQFPSESNVLGRQLIRKRKKLWLPGDP